MIDITSGTRGLWRFDGLRKRWPLWVFAAATPAALGTLLAMGARWSWLLELFTHFHFQYLAILAIGAACCLAAKKRWLATVLGIFAAWNLALIAPLYLPPVAPENATGRTVRALLANVHVHNRDHGRFLQLVRDQSPDVIVVLEVNRGWLTALEVLNDEYPYHAGQPREDSFGIAFFSRLPADSVALREIGPAELPSVIARIDCGANVALELLGTHPLPPTSAEYAAFRNQQLRAVAQIVRGLPRPTVLVGDLNTTSWSPWFRELIDISNMRDSRLGFGVQPSWPGRAAAIGIAIDHVLISRDIAVERRMVGPDIGSDHRPVTVDLRIRKDGEDSADRKDQ